MKISFFIFLLNLLKIFKIRVEIINDGNHVEHNCIHSSIGENPRILEGEPNLDATIGAEEKRLKSGKPPKFKPMRIHFDFSSIFFVL